jgi:hypothetical protein
MNKEVLNVKSVCVLLYVVVVDICRGTKESRVYFGFVRGRTGC